VKAPGGLLAVAIGPKGKGAASEDEAPEPTAEASPKDEYKSVLADAAKAGDWDAFAEAVEGLVRSCGMKE
jgi:uncharacterized membrane protein (UPF0182 family)